MIRKLSFLTVVLAVACLSAFAARAETRVTVGTHSGCYRLDEAEAEQAIRIHSELMVIGLNCQTMWKTGDGRSLYAKYRIWTAQHGKLIAEYEGRLIGYFLRQGAGDPEALFNSMRTEFANKVATDAARMRPDAFCAQYAPRIDKVASMDDRTYRRWAATFFPGHPPTHPVCGH
jgi:hypothetical protein